ncbi:hypothetical protein ACROYT_G020884 [Oculina patagonica]
MRAVQGSFNPANVACVAISDCRRDVRSHLVYCKISDDSGVDSEAKLLLTRAAICRQCREYLINIMSRVTVSEDISEPVQSSVMPSDKEEQEKSDKSAQEEEDDISAASDEDLTAGLGRMTISDDSPVFSPESASTVSSSGEGSGFARIYKGQAKHDKTNITSTLVEKKSQIISVAGFIQAVSLPEWGRGLLKRENAKDRIPFSTENQLLTECGIFLLVVLCGIGYCAGVCYDQRWDCSDLAHRGDCQSNPYAMLRECPISCRVDCVSGEEPSPKFTERQTSMLGTGPDYEASGSTRDIHELQAALQAAQLTATGTGTKYSGTHKDSHL